MVLLQPEVLQQFYFWKLHLHYKLFGCQLQPYLQIKTTFVSSCNKTRCTQKNQLEFCVVRAMHDLHYRQGQGFNKICSSQLV